MAQKPIKLIRPWVAQRKPFEREKANKSFYNSRPWRKLSKQKRELNPLCELCEARGEVVVGKVADHIIPINKGGEPLSLNNLQTLCEKCHNAKSGRGG